MSPQKIFLERSFNFTNRSSGPQIKSWLWLFLVNINLRSEHELRTSLPLPRLLVDLCFEYSKFKLFVGNFWVVLTHEYYKVSFMRHMIKFSILLSPRKMFLKVRIWLAQELMRSQKLDANEDPLDFLEQVAILDDHPYLLWSLSFLMKSSFITKTKSISHISQQVSLESCATVTSVVLMTRYAGEVHGPAYPAGVWTDIWHPALTESHLKGKGVFSSKKKFPRFCEEICKFSINKNMIFHEFTRIVTWIHCRCLQTVQSSQGPYPEVGADPPRTCTCLRTLLPLAL